MVERFQQSNSYQGRRRLSIIIIPEGIIEIKCSRDSKATESCRLFGSTDWNAYLAVKPPSMAKIWPVVYEESIKSGINSGVEGTPTLLIIYVMMIHGI
jgi:hypothetical protein